MSKKIGKLPEYFGGRHKDAYPPFATYSTRLNVSGDYRFKCQKQGAKFLRILLLYIVNSNCLKVIFQPD